MRVYQSKKEKNTFEIGRSIGKKTFDGMIILLYGDLGAGKTVFTKGLAKGMNINDNVSSPTYTIVHVHIGDKTLYHFDLYRLHSEEDFEDIGGYEYIDSGAICIFEWASRLEWQHVDGYLRIDIKYVQDDKREITLSTSGKKYDDWLSEYDKK